MLNLEQIGLLGLLATTLGLFIWGKWRYDIVVLTALSIAVLLGYVPANEAFTGFSHPATVTVAIVLIISYGLSHVGATEKIVQFIAPMQHKPQLQLAVLLGIAAILSTVMNNIAALSLTMPVATHVFVKSNRSPSMVLMPLAFATILGGLVSLIGTPPNIVISGYREEFYGEPFRMFDFAPVGGILAFMGIIFLVFVGSRLIGKKSKTKNAKPMLYTYIYEVQLDDDSRLIGKSLAEVKTLLKDTDLRLLSLIKDASACEANLKETFANHDVLLIEGTHNAVDRFITEFNLRMIHAESAEDSIDTITHSNDTDTTEVVVLPTSKIEGRTPEQIGFNRYYGINLLAVARRGKSFCNRLRSLRFTIGDVLLLHGNKEELSGSVEHLGCLPLAQPSPKFGKRKHALPAIAIFLAGIIAASFSLLPLEIIFLMVAGAMVFMNLILVKDIYEQINWPIIVLIAGMIPISKAFETTGLANAIAQFLFHSVGNIPIVFVILILFVLTMLLSELLNNSATVLIIAPIARMLAEQMQVNPDTFLMAITIAASCAFLTPIGHQNNALIMEAGGYKFTDYWRLGLPLQFLITLFAIPLLLVFWPL